jgi:uncharacterized protein
MTITDAHCHFFSRRFFDSLFDAVLRQAPDTPGRPEDRLVRAIAWEAPGDDAALADRWARELDQHGVARAALIASLPGDEHAVATAVRRHPSRFVGAFMFDPTTADASTRLATALDELGMRTVCLFPAMHRYYLHDAAVARVFEAAQSRPGTAVFVHCGALSVGIRAKLGLPSPFEIRFGNPIDLHGVALAYSRVPIVIPHFGAGLFREALMLADLCPNVHFDSSSSNSWIRYHPDLMLPRVFAQALAVAGPRRILFGTDSSFFPRGWQREVYDAQQRIWDELGTSGADRALIMGGNFDRLFPVTRGPA